ncbi:uncharacterized protein PADG_06531 [Paracoccidioides brasiliensis Pb18]|uniref:Uncharacterized protein n=1 Tax=Paracoccidioides brasiliensis (strain Pb18) TaxID=502780 RepID=C1GGU4_PARBD|nr:uncharacterized protein PADG_06531 [Paracoccidioides brasiliensis Pb18]EEH50452.2 hypothetical protein PADG_06531 [Paracoccidioides brasiliensis Pb18]
MADQCLRRTTKPRTDLHLLGCLSVAGGRVGGDIVVFGPWDSAGHILPAEKPTQNKPGNGWGGGLRWARSNKCESIIDIWLYAWMMGLREPATLRSAHPGIFSGWRSGIARPNGEQKAVGAVSCHQVSQIIMRQGLALRADADGQSPLLAGRRVPRSLKPSNQERLGWPEPFVRG